MKLTRFQQVMVFGLQDATPTCRRFSYHTTRLFWFRNFPTHFPKQVSCVALDVAKWDSCPQIRQIQSALLSLVVLLPCPFLLTLSLLQHFGFGTENATQSFHFLPATISSAQLLGLDCLGSDPAGTPMHDLAFCGYPRPLAFELSKRLYHHLCFIDGTS